MTSNRAQWHNATNGYDVDTGSSDNPATTSTSTTANLNAYNALSFSGYVVVTTSGNLSFQWGTSGASQSTTLNNGTCFRAYKVA